MTDLNLQKRWIAYINAGGDLYKAPYEFRNEQIQDLFLKSEKC
jgi:hypothetical protein